MRGKFAKTRNRVVLQHPPTNKLDIHSLIVDTPPLVFSRVEMQGEPDRPPGDDSPTGGGRPPGGEYHLSDTADDSKIFTNFASNGGKFEFHLQGVPYAEAVQLLRLFRSLSVGTSLRAAELQRKLVSRLEQRCAALRKKHLPERRKFFERWRRVFAQRQRLRANLKYVIAAVSLPNVIVVFLSLVKHWVSHHVSQCVGSAGKTKINVVALAVRLSRGLSSTNFPAPGIPNPAQTTETARSYYSDIRNLITFVREGPELAKPFADFVEYYGQLALSLLLVVLDTVLETKTVCAGQSLPEGYLFSGGRKCTERTFNHSIINEYLGHLGVPPYAFFCKLDVVEPQLKACPSVKQLLGFLKLLHDLAVDGQLVVSADGVGARLTCMTNKQLADVVATLAQ